MYPPFMPYILIPHIHLILASLLPGPSLLLLSQVFHFRFIEFSDALDGVNSIVCMYAVLQPLLHF